MFIHSIRFKLIALTVISSLLPVVIILSITPKMVENRFLQEASDFHMGRITQELIRFSQEVEGWGTQQAAIDLHKTIVERRSINRRSGPAGRPNLGRQFVAPVQGNRPPPGRELQRHEDGGPLEHGNMRFMVADHNGFIFHPYYEFMAGQQLNVEQLERATALYDEDNLLLGYALAVGETKFSERDQSYLDMLEETLKIAASIAALVAFLFAFGTTRSIHKRLHSLIRATRNLSQQKKPELLNMRGRDEVSRLAKEFDAMSVKLTSQYQQLKESHQTIASQARTLEQLSYTDELTRLSNRRFFNEQLANMQADEMNQVSLILGDVDHFKRVNDNFSHETGDKVLQQVATLMQENTRSKDIVARIGGEELVVLMPNTDKEKALDIAERIRQAVADYPWHKMALGLSVTLSSGVCCASELDDPTQILQAADEFLYQAKDGGRNRVCG